jgi:hypothetical protein
MDGGDKVMQKSESIVKLTSALIKAKQKFAPLVRNQDNPGFKRGNQVSRYADLAAVIEATEAPLLENGLVLTQFPHNDGERVGVQNMLVHESGEFLEHTFTVAIVKQDAQTSVAGITYARRVSMKAILGISDEDDDGNTASGTGTSGQAQEVKKPAQTSTKAVGPPKAEIPTSLGPASKAPAAQPSQGEPVTGEKPASSPAGSSEMPTSEQLDGFRADFKKLGDELSGAGLKASPKLPINRKIANYLCKVAGAESTDKLTVKQWTTFLQIVGAARTAEGGIKSLIPLVNAANGIEEKK